jgi:hypothetical protein
MDPLTALAALGPLAVDLGKTLINRWVGKDGYTPRSFDEWSRMRQADIDLFRAMNDAGAAGVAFPWVEAVIKLQRPAVVAVALLTWAAQSLLQPGGATAEVANFASSVGFYLFGDRTLFYSRRMLGGVGK